MRARVLCCLPVLLWSGAFAHAQGVYGSMRNGSFDRPQQRKADEPGIAEAVANSTQQPKYAMPTKRMEKDS